MFPPSQNFKKSSILCIRQLVSVNNITHTAHNVTMNRNIDQPIRPSLKTFTDNTPHPSYCRGNVCSQDARELVVQNRLNQNDNDVLLRQLQQQRKYPHPINASRFVEHNAENQHSRAFRRTRNNRATREVLRMDLT